MVSVNIKSIPSVGQFQHNTHTVDWMLFRSSDGTSASILFSLEMYYDESKNDLEVHVDFKTDYINRDHVANYVIGCSEIACGDGDNTDRDTDIGEEVLESFFDHISKPQEF